MRSMESRELGICIFCDKEVYIKDEENPPFQLAIDRPVYCNLPVHKKCFREYQDNGKLQAFLNENLYYYLDKYDDEETRNVQKKKSKKPKAVKESLGD